MRLSTSSLKELIIEANNGFASGERSQTGVIQVRMNNVDLYGHLNLADVIRVPASEHQIKKTSLTEGDVLFNCTNSVELVGKSALFKGFSEPVTYSNHFIRLKVNTDKLEPSYLARWLTKEQTLGRFRLLSNRWVNQATVPREALLKLHIPLLPLPEQLRIATILDKADAIRCKQQRVVERMEDFLRSVFLDMFGDPVTNPKGWDKAKLCEVCEEIYRYPTFYGFKYIEKGIPVVRIGNILPNGHLNPDLSDYVFIDSGTSNRFTRTILEYQDIVMAVRGDGSTAKRIGLVSSKELEGANISPNLLRFKAREGKLNSLYLFTCMISKSGQCLLDRYVTRTAKKTITARDIKLITIPVPPYPLQMEFANVFNQIEKIRNNVDSLMSESNYLFNSLVHRAFHGELTSSAADAILQEAVTG